jgi:hypothetical protein
MARVPSIGRQVELMINQSDLAKGLGQSKKTQREQSKYKGENKHNVSDRVHTVDQLNNIRRELTNFGKYIKDKHNIKEIKDMTSEHLKEYLNNKVTENNLSKRYTSNLFSYFRKSTLLDGINFKASELDKMKANIREQAKENIQSTRAYTPKEEKKIFDNINPKYKEPIEFLREIGTRAGTITNIKFTDKTKNELTNPKNFNNFLKQEKESLGLKGQDKLSFITKDNSFVYVEKGGKMNIRESLSQATIDKIKNHQKDGVYQVSYNTLLYNYKTAIEQVGLDYRGGLHSLRHSAVQEDKLNGLTDEEISSKTGHVRKEITKTYYR